MVGCTLGEESIAGTVPAAPMRQAVSCRGRAFDGGERTHAQYTDAVFLERRCTVPPCTPGAGGQGVTFDFVPVDPQNPPEDLIDLNPYHSVPTLVERELVLYAASVVSEYLDERYPHPPLMPVDPLSRARIRLAMLRIEHDWVPQVQAIQLGNKTQAEAGRKRLKELLTASLPLFKASKFFLNPEMSLADCAMAPIIWRLQSLDVPLPKDGKAIEDYGNRIFRHPGFVRSLTEQEKKLRDLPV